MDKQVISDNLSLLLHGRDVIAAVFTTYTFEPEFFELEVIPLLLPGDTAFSTDPRIKSLQVREKLRISDVTLEVFFDQEVFIAGADASPSMEYLCHGVRCGNSAFHGKVNLVLVRDRQSERDCLLVGAGSNNLTRAGWWDNIECQHWEEVRRGNASRAFLNRLNEDVEYLRDQRRLHVEPGHSALDSITSYLADTSWSHGAPRIDYYGLNHVGQRGNFHRFLRQITRQQWSYSNWKLEIISPFFSTDAANDEYKFFFGLGVREILLLLPKDQEGKALCGQQYFEHVDAADGIRWASWSDRMAIALGLRGKSFRRLHAKIYHFHNKKQSWAFIGSVNFSHKAMRENVEAGFFVELPAAGPLLEAIDGGNDVEFAPPEEAEPGHHNENGAGPLIYLSYDWIERKLVGVAEPGGRYTISIMTPEGAEAVENFAIMDEECRWAVSVEALEKLLRNGSLVKVEGFDTGSGEPFSPKTVMVQQTGWSHKPLDMLNLTAVQILAIYADMAPERRELLLVNARVRELVLRGEAGELTEPMDSFTVDQFFCEFAEIFHAFRRLREKLLAALEGDNFAVADYYLTGAGMDSMPALIESTTKETAHARHVTAYLVLLCAKELYQHKLFSNRPQVMEKLALVNDRLETIKGQGGICLEDNSAASRDRFFHWFESQFFRTYQTRRSPAQ